MEQIPNKPASTTVHLWHILLAFGVLASFLAIAVLKWKILIVRQDVSGLKAQVELLRRGIAEKTDADAEVSEKKPAPVVTAQSNWFDPETIKVGDKVAGLTLVSVGPILDRPLSADNVKAEFRGTVTLLATYDYSFNEFFGGVEMVCLRVEETEEVIKLPQVQGEVGGAVFCLRDAANLKSLFGPDYGTGTATVTIKDFTLLYAPTEVVSEATLVKLVSKKAQ